MQIEGGTAAVEVFCFEDNDGMIQCQCKLRFPTAELTFWWPEISWKPSSLAVMWGSLFGRENLLFKHFYTLHKESSRKKEQSIVFVDILYVIGCRDACGS